jgi:hypothetical protein
MAVKNSSRKRGVRQPLAFVPDSYLDRTSRPVYSLCFLLGFILLYEVGTFLIQPEALQQTLVQPRTRVVAFIWIQNLLEYIGFSGRMTWIAAPMVVIVILLALQATSRQPWKVQIADFIPMTLECIVMSVPLIVLSLLLNRQEPVPPPAACIALQSAASGHDLWMNLVTGIGAGIYEELVFRLILIGLLMVVFQDLLNLEKGPAILLSVLISAVLFSVHHHVFIINGRLGTGEYFAVSKFAFRLLAGIYFAGIFAIRGYGVTAGTHAFYDILAAFLNALVFGRD